MRAAGCLLTTLALLAAPSHAFDLHDIRYFRETGYRWCRECDLAGAQLRGAGLAGAELQGANLFGAKLRGANLRGAELQRANLSGAELQGANLIAAGLQGASLAGAKLQGANLGAARLQGANLDGAELQDAKLPFTNFTDAIYAPIGLPDSYVEGITGLSTVTIPYHDRTREVSVTGLVQLREILQKAGLRDREREVTYAIERNITQHPLAHWWENPSAAFLALLRLIFIEWTTGYGLYPFHALLILLWSIVGFAAIYLFPLTIMTGSGGIHRVWPGGRLEARSSDAEWCDQVRVERLRPRGGWGLGVVGRALQFSVLSAFHLGFREFNVGSWIARVQAHEYTLRATGWVRVVAGLQSLLSIYLIAIWVLTYFGRPFQ